LPSNELFLSFHFLKYIVEPYAIIPIVTTAALFNSLPLIIPFKKNHYLNMRIKTFIVDAFTNTPFKGNPAGVCLLEEAIKDETMQSIATALNLSETAFLLKTENNHFAIRFFTPTVEVVFCGHATLAASKVILDKFNTKTVDFTTDKGLQLNATLENESIKMLFPLYETTEYRSN
jgi:predicted PhzF superfamily epimerase YddE/YHI9